ncbi:hypothetical protein SNTW_12570 [Helicobacter suis]|uniref:Uncharacterized protein n=4 Tax=Helicobacter suis TaxID=104628 RepID=A0A6J4D0R1_9HELI|nr:hypothetical protein SNTW_12570 [Helicobacter suis]
MSSKQHHRTLQAYGIDLNGKTYQSAQFWDKCEIGDSLVVVENPDNPNEVDVYTPTMQYLAKATCTDLGALAMDQKGFRAAKKSHKERELKPFIGEVERAKAMANKKRQAKIDEIIGRRLDILPIAKARGFWDHQDLPARRVLQLLLQEWMPPLYEYLYLRSNLYPKKSHKKGNEKTYLLGLNPL